MPKARAKTPARAPQQFYLRVLRKLSTDSLTVHSTDPVFLGYNYVCLALYDRLLVMHSVTFTVVSCATYSSAIQNMRLHYDGTANFMYVLTDDWVVHCHAIEPETGQMYVVSRHHFKLAAFANDFFIDAGYLLAFHLSNATLYSLETGLRVAELHGHYLKIQRYHKVLSDCQCGRAIDTFTDVLDDLETATSVKKHYSSTKAERQSVRIQVKQKSSEDNGALVYLGSYNNALLAYITGKLKEFQTGRFYCESCYEFPSVLRFASSYCYGEQVFPSARQIIAAYSAALRDSDEQWEFTQAAIHTTRESMFIVIFGEIPELVVFQLRMEQLAQNTKTQQVTIAYPTTRVHGMISNAWLDESLFGTESYSATANIADAPCDLFAADVCDLHILGADNGTLRVAAYSWVYGYFRLDIKLNQLLLGNFADQIRQGYDLSAYERQAYAGAEKTFSVVEAVFCGAPLGLRDGQHVQAIRGRYIMGFNMCASGKNVYLMAAQNNILRIQNGVYQRFEIPTKAELTGIHVAGSTIYCWGNEELVVLEIPK